MNRALVRSLALLVLTPAIGAPLAASGHEASTEAEVRQHVIDYFATIRETLADPTDSIHADGALQFWSSGGMLQEVSPERQLSRYDAFSLWPKHIEVIVLAEGEVAVAMYYAEGSMTPRGNPPVARYLTRVTEVLVKENGKWQARAGHWSPVLGGSGTSQSAE